MRKKNILFGLFCTALIIACSTENAGDKVIELSGSSRTSNSSAGGDANGVSNGSGGSTDGTCGPAFDFATAKQQCTNCHAAAGGNAKWSTADGTEEQWRLMADKLKASVEADRMPMPQFSADNKAKFISFIDGLTGACTPAPVAGGGGDGGTGGGAGSNPNEMSLAEAKMKCAGCHIPGGSGAHIWDKANGTEDDWRNFAPLARPSVAADRMPKTPLVDPDKSRMLAYLDKLLGGQANQPVTYTLETAKVLCVGCHSASAPQGQRETPYLETLSQWQQNKEDIQDEVSKRKMPQGKTLSDEERRALLDFISTL
jgi:cytochrome c553